MLVIRGSAAGGGEPARTGDAPPVPADVNEAVRLAHLAGQAAGEPVSQRRLAERFGVSRRQVSRALAAAPNGRASLNGHAEGVSN
jgi:transcriptional regulator GlxA family with amidase domain